MKTYIFSLILTLFLITDINTQPSIPSANGQNFAKYVDVPISYFTGTGSVNVPIASVSDGTLSHNISLSYHTGGNRVADVASPVGLGWTLMAGGAVTRTIRGVADDDESNKGFYHDGSTLTTGHEDEVADGDRDGEPDLFIFNFDGISGKFFFDENGDIITIPKTNLKITPHLESDKFTGFEIITGTGTKYYFGYCDESWQSDDGYSSDKRDDFTMAWYLERVISFDDKHHIDFTYSNDYYLYKVNSDCSTLSSKNGSTQVFEDGDCEIELISASYKGSKLESISTSTETVDMSYSTRDDLGSFLSAYASKLDEIEYSTGSYCYEFSFDYDYFEDPSETGYISKRLQLKEVQKSECDAITLDDSNSEPAWEFNYYGDVNGNGSLFFPSYISKAIDHWGFYNGHTSNDNLDNITPYTCEEGQCYGSAQRESVEEEMLHGALKKVIYPTGGYTEFTYEANEQSFENSSGLNNLLIDTVSCADAGACCGTFYTEKNIILTDSIIENGFFTLELLPYVNPCYSGKNPESKVQIYDDTDGGSLEHTTSFNSYVNDQVTVYLNTIGGLTAGNNFRFKVSSYYCKSIFQLRNVPNRYNQICGGLRIAKTKAHDGDASNDIIKNFKYYNPEDTTESSGRISEFPQYSHHILTSGSYKTVLFNSTSIRPLSSLEGYHVGYEHVTVDYNGNGSQTFQHNIEFSPGDTTDYPIIPPSAKLYNGVMDLSKTYNETGTLEAQSTITRKSTDYYTVDPSLVYRSAKVKGYNGAIWVDATLRTEYSNRTGIYRPEEKEDLLDGITTTTDYTYSSTVVFAPTKTSITNSNSKVIDNFTTYTGDYYSAGLKAVFVARNMLEIPYESLTNVNSTQIDGSKTIYSNYLTGGTRTTSTSTSYFPRPYQIERYERTWYNGSIQSGSWNTKMTYHEYRSNGLIYRSQKDGWWETHYDYYSNKLPKNKIYGNFWTEYAYDGSSKLLAEVESPDNTTTSYTYDDLMRLSSVTTDCNGASTSYDYHFSTGGADKNYLKTTVDYETPTALSDLDVLVTFKYMDKLGRTIQTVRKQQAPGDDDIVTALEYDQFGRIDKQYETQTNGAGTGAYVTPSSWNYSFTEYFDSPLNRVKKVTPLGSLAAVEYTYGSNAASEVKIDGGGTDYSADLLSKSTVKDGNGNKTIVYKDKIGRTVLTRRTNSAESSSKNLDTYTIYDDKNRAYRVLPPGVTTSHSDLFYEYEYDGEDRVIEKKVPGADVVNYKYNSRHLLGGYQDGYLRNISKWYTYTVDQYGRELTSGLYSGTPTTNFTPSEKLTENIYGTSGIEIDKVKTTKAKILGTSDWLETTFTYDVCGRDSLSSGNHHVSPGTSNTVTAAFTYDGASNLVKTISSINAHSISKNIEQKTQIDEYGRVFQDYFKVGTIERIISENVFNYKDQLVTQYQGETGNGKTGNLEFAQKIDYTYRTDGLLQKINDDNLTGSLTALSSCFALSPGDPSTSNYDNKDLFYSILYYDDAIESAADQENGNIANVEWQVRGRDPQMYAHEYDEYNRLLSSEYHDYISSDWSHTGIYDTEYSYDDRGNFEELKRKGKIVDGGCFDDVTIDSLTYSYNTNSNKLKSVTDIGNAAYGFKENSGSSTTYTYDDNGNMITDVEKGITSITYNHLDLPTVITNGTETITYTYDGNGTLLSKELDDGSTTETTDYIAGIEYIDGTIDAIYHSEGRVKYDSGDPQFQYYIRDHLGNNRILYADADSNGIVSTPSEIIEENHYYPFGLAMEGPWMSNGGMKYAYNGIEYEDFMGLDMNMATFRGLDPALGRWCQIDPKAEYLYGMTPYNSMGNNPILYNDPNGDVIPLLVAGAAIIGAGQNVYSNWDKIVKNPWSAIGYTVTGAVGGGLSVANPALGRLVTAGGNVATDVASGNAPDINGFGDLLEYAGGTTLDAISVGGSGKIAKLGVRGLSALGADFATDMMLQNPETFGNYLYTLTEINSLGEVLYEESVIKSLSINSFASQAAPGLASNFVTNPGLLSTSSSIVSNNGLPPKTIVNEKGVTIEHYYGSGDHGPPHAHVKGKGPDTRIGQNGHPLKGDPELSRTQKKVINRNKKSIRRSIKKIMKWFKKL